MRNTWAATRPVVRRPTVRGLALAAALLLAATGCRSIPDCGPWSEATKSVASGVTEAFGAAARVNGGIAEGLTTCVATDTSYERAAKRYAQLEADLRSASDRYAIVFGGMADYADSLAAIAKAANNAQTTVDSVAGSLNGFISTVGGTPVAGVVLDVAKEIAVAAIRFKAADDFADAVAQADPTIQQIAALVKQDLAALQKSVGTTKDDPIRTALEEPFAKDVQYYAEMQKRRRDLFDQTRALVESGKPVLADPTAAELAAVDKYLAQADAWHGPLTKSIDSALAARRSAAELVVQTSKAVDAWAASHKSLAVAAQQKRAPETARLVALATQIRDIVDELKNRGKDR